MLLLLFFDFKLSRFAGDKEKKATSEPEIKAELINSKIMKASPKKSANSGFLNTILVNVLIFSNNGSVSKISYICFISIVILNSIFFAKLIICSIFNNLIKYNF